jgi:hypothetical protein
VTRNSVAVREAAPRRAWKNLYFADADRGVQNPRPKGTLARFAVPFFNDTESSEGSP